MRMCNDCWAKLKNAIDVRGLTPFVAKSGQEVVERKLASQDEASSFEPLMDAHNAIVANLLDAFGVAMIAVDGCPVCAAISGCQCGLGNACGLRTWIDRAAEDQLTRARALGLIEAVS